MPPPPTVVLLEGRSDVVAVASFARRRAAGELDGVELVDLGGVTNIGGRLERLSIRPEVTRAAGLCDRGEVDVVVRALRRFHPDVQVMGDLAARGFFVCDRDLEDELIRGLGVPGCMSLLDRLGLGERFATFCRQPAWQSQPIVDQLHRFVGTTSGRKELFAGEAAGAIPLDRVPPPIADLLDYVVA
ncbi:hypothetical protein HJ588_18490 [Flexivirga sp. ID2601S]|uniref:ATP-dependent endonuclease n=1 Tax=Flexivirga aerilata TaxID=1656889 RepID=A0A849APB0_9MICO|nr:hypothetical protein [Flexivirga aerilata]NNG41251.1 hypothetical protein [Flexivirga aerilata]